MASGVMQPISTPSGHGAIWMLASGMGTSGRWHPATFSTGTGTLTSLVRPQAPEASVEPVNSRTDTATVSGLFATFDFLDIFPQ